MTKKERQVTLPCVLSIPKCCIPIYEDVLPADRQDNICLIVAASVNNSHRPNPTLELNSISSLLVRKASCTHTPASPFPHLSCHSATSSTTHKLAHTSDSDRKQSLQAPHLDLLPRCLVVTLSFARQRYLVLGPGNGSPTRAVCHLCWQRLFELPLRSLSRGRAVVSSHRGGQRA